MQVGGRLGAVGLVAGVVHLVELLGLGVPAAQRLHLAGTLVAEDGAVQVVDGGEKLRGEVLAQLVDHVDEDVGGRGGNTGARRHGALALHGVIGAEDEGHRIEEIDGGLGGVGVGRKTLQVEDTSCDAAQEWSGLAQDNC